MVHQQDEVRLHGKKVVLREKDISDAGNDYTWATDSELMHLDASEPFPLSFSTFVLQYPHRLLDNGKIQFAIEVPVAKHIGNCTCYDIDTVRKEAELGIMIGDRDYWGKGYGTEAVQILMDYVFRVLDIERIVLHTLTWNSRARACFTKCGFIECGWVQRTGNEFIKMEARSPWIDQVTPIHP